MNLDWINTCILKLTMTKFVDHHSSLIWFFIFFTIKSNYFEHTNSPIASFLSDNSEKWKVTQISCLSILWRFWSTSESGFYFFQPKFSNPSWRRIGGIWARDWWRREVGEAAKAQSSSPAKQTTSRPYQNQISALPKSGPNASKIRFRAFLIGPLVFFERPYAWKRHTNVSGLNALGSRNSLCIFRSRFSEKCCIQYYFIIKTLMTIYWRNGSTATRM